MTIDEKRAIMAKISDILDEYVDQISQEPVKNEIPEMLTIKECSKTIKGLTEHAVRRLALRGEIPFVRIGDGKYGKILISKWNLIGYFENKKAKTPPIKV